MDRSRNILKYLVPSGRDKKVICKTCVGFSDGELPSVSCFYGICAVKRDISGRIYVGVSHEYAPLFDNTIHTIITTMDFCRGRDFGCDVDCENCMVPIAQKKFKK